MSILDGPKPLIIAHRGAPLLAFENTLSSFEKAVEQGAGIIELDVQMTRDRKLIVFHDSDVDRVTWASGLIKQFTLEEVRKMRLGGSSSIPTLEETLAAFKGRVGFFVELKRIPEAVEEALKVIAAAGVIDDTVVCSFDPRVIRAARQVSKTIPLGYLRWVVFDRDISFMRKHDMQAMHVNDVFLSEEVVRKVHEQGQKCITWTPGWKSWIRRALDKGVDGVITNHVGRLIEVVEARTLEQEHAASDATKE